MANESINSTLNRLSGRAMDALYPVKCPFCGAVMGRATDCDVCRDDLPRCDTFIAGAGFGRAAAPLWYTGRVRAAITAFKFKGKTGGVRTFGAMMAQTAAEQYSGAFDTITWVPISRKRLRKRGYDQTRLLAAALCVDWHVEPLELLEKTVDNAPQSECTSRAGRRANVLGVYRVTDPSAVQGRRILLVDDIFTTGATLSEAARVLKDAGAADVMCLTLAITPEKDV